MPVINMCNFPSVYSIEKVWWLRKRDGETGYHLKYYEQNYFTQLLTL
jgi:hypothetical protein